LIWNFSIAPTDSFEFNRNKYVLTANALDLGLVKICCMSIIQ